MGQPVRATDVPGKDGDDELRLFVRHQHRRIAALADDVRRDGAHGDARRADEHQRVPVEHAAHEIRQAAGIGAALHVRQSRGHEDVGAAQDIRDPAGGRLSGVGEGENDRAHFSAFLNSVVKPGSYSLERS